MRELSHDLFDSEISHDFLTASITADEFETLLEPLNIHAHSTPGDGPSAEDLAGLVANETGGPGGLEFEQRDGASQVLVLLFVVHLRHLVRDVV